MEDNSDEIGYELHQSIISKKDAAEMSLKQAEEMLSELAEKLRKTLYLLNLMEIRECTTYSAESKQQVNKRSIPGNYEEHIESNLQQLVIPEQEDETKNTYYLHRHEILRKQFDESSLEFTSEEVLDETEEIFKPSEIPCRVEIETRDYKNESEVEESKCISKKEVHTEISSFEETLSSSETFKCKDEQLVIERTSESTLTTFSEEIECVSDDGNLDSNFSPTKGIESSCSTGKDPQHGKVQAFSKNEMLQSGNKFEESVINSDRVSNTSLHGDNPALEMQDSRCESKQYSSDFLSKNEDRQSDKDGSTGGTKVHKLQTVASDLLMEEYRNKDSNQDFTLKQWCRENSVYLGNVLRQDQYPNKPNNDMTCTTTRCDKSPDEILFTERQVPVAVETCKCYKRADLCHAHEASSEMFSDEFCDNRQTISIQYKGSSKESLDGKTFPKTCIIFEPSVILGDYTPDLNESRTRLQECYSLQEQTDVPLTLIADIGKSLSNNTIEQSEVHPNNSSIETMPDDGNVNSSVSIVHQRRNRVLQPIRISLNSASCKLYQCLLQIYRPLNGTKVYMDGSFTLNIVSHGYKANVLCYILAYYCCNMKKEASCIEYPVRPNHTKEYAKFEGHVALKNLMSLFEQRFEVHQYIRDPNKENEQRKDLNPNSMQLAFDYFLQRQKRNSEDLLLLWILPGFVISLDSHDITEIQFMTTVNHSEQTTQDSIVASITIADLQSEWVTNYRADKTPIKGIHVGQCETEQNNDTRNSEVGEKLPFQKKGFNKLHSGLDVLPSSSHQSNENYESRIQPLELDHSLIDLNKACIKRNKKGVSHLLSINRVRNEKETFADNNLNNVSESDQFPKPMEYALQLSCNPVGEDKMKHVDLDCNTMEMQEGSHLLTMLFYGGRQVNCTSNYRILRDIKGFGWNDYFRNTCYLWPPASERKQEYGKSKQDTGTSVKAFKQFFKMDNENRQQDAGDIWRSKLVGCHTVYEARYMYFSIPVCSDEKLEMQLQTTGGFKIDMNMTTLNKEWVVLAELPNKICQLSKGFEVQKNDESLARENLTASMEACQQVAVETWGSIQYEPNRLDETQSIKQVVPTDSSFTQDKVDEARTELDNLKTSFPISKGIECEKCTGGLEKTDLHEIEEDHLNLSKFKNNEKNTVSNADHCHPFEFELSIKRNFPVDALPKAEQQIHPANRQQDKDALHPYKYKHKSTDLQKDKISLQGEKVKYKSDENRNIKVKIKDGNGLPVCLSTNYTTDGVQVGDENRMVVKSKFNKIAGDEREIVDVYDLVRLLPPLFEDLLVDAPDDVNKDTPFWPCILTTMVLLLYYDVEIGISYMYAVFINITGIYTAEYTSKQRTTKPIIGVNYLDDKVFIDIHGEPSDHRESSLLIQSGYRNKCLLFGPKMPDKCITVKRCFHPFQKMHPFHCFSPHVHDEMMPAVPSMLESGQFASRTSRLYLKPSVSYKTLLIGSFHNEAKWDAFDIAQMLCTQTFDVEIAMGKVIVDIVIENWPFHGLVCSTDISIGPINHELFMSLLNDDKVGDCRDNIDKEQQITPGTQNKFGLRNVRCQGLLSLRTGFFSCNVCKNTPLHVLQRSEVYESYKIDSFTPIVESEIQYRARKRIAKYLGTTSLLHKCKGKLSYVYVYVYTYVYV